MITHLKALIKGLQNQERNWAWHHPEGGKTPLTEKALLLLEILRMVNLLQELMLQGDPLRLYSTTKSDANHCLAFCKSQYQCEWWSYDTKQDKCQLFKSCPTLDEAQNNYISGQVNCGSCKYQSLLNTNRVLQYFFNYLTSK